MRLRLRNISKEAIPRKRSFFSVLGHKSYILLCGQNSMLPCLEKSVENLRDSRGRQLARFTPPRQPLRPRRDVHYGSSALDFCLRSARPPRRGRRGVCRTVNCPKHVRKCPLRRAPKTSFGFVFARNANTGPTCVRTITQQFCWHCPCRPCRLALFALSPWQLQALRNADPIRQVRESYGGTRLWARNRVRATPFLSPNREICRGARPANLTRIVCICSAVRWRGKKLSTNIIVIVLYAVPYLYIRVYVTVLHTGWSFVVHITRLCRCWLSRFVSNCFFQKPRAGFT